jgi:MSHA biogenesis protein MshO
MRRNGHGFSLIELLVVIIITGIIGAAVAVFIRLPVQGYVDSARRAELTDIADTAWGRIARELRMALPYSVRITGAAAPGSTLALEFLSTRTSGRYRVEPDSTATGPGDILDFTGADVSFDVLGPAIALYPADQIVIDNLGLTSADAYAGNTGPDHNRRAVYGPDANGTEKTNVKIVSSNPFPRDSPRHIFHVVDTPVSYVCDLATGQLKRYWGYSIAAVQGNPPGGGHSALIAQNVSNCNFTIGPGVTYGPPTDVKQRSSLFAMWLELTKDGETVTLHYEVHIDNVR